MESQGCRDHRVGFALPRTAIADLDTYMHAPCVARVASRVCTFSMLDLGLLHKDAPLRCDVLTRTSLPTRPLDHVVCSCFFPVVSLSVHRYQKAEVLERSLVEDFTTAEFRSSVHEVFKNAQAGIQTDNFEFPLYTKDGKCVYVLLNASSRSDRDGELRIHDQQQLLQVALHMPAPANL